MFGNWHNWQIGKSFITHRKHVKRRVLNICVTKQQFSSGKYIKMDDLYARLGLTDGVSQLEIKKAYFKLSKKHHPDKNEGCDISAAKFRSITEAYEILGNVKSRAQYDKETARLSRRTRSSSYYNKPQSSAAFHEKDEEFAEKIRTYRENMRRRGKKPREDNEFQFRRENVFDFDAWYRAHFYDDFDTKLKDDRIKKFTEQYREQMERISRGEFRIRPPRPYVERREASDIENQFREMAEKEIRKNILHTLYFGLLCFIAFFIVLYVVEEYKKGDNAPYEDPYVKKKLKESRKTQEK